MKKLPTFFIGLLPFAFSCGKGEAVAPIPETVCYTCTTMYIESTEPPTPGYPDTLLFSEEYCGNLADFEREEVMVTDVGDAVLTITTTVTCE